MKEANAKKKIWQIEDEDKNQYRGQKEVANAFVMHFKNLLGVGKGNIDASVFSSMNGHALDEED